MSVANESEATGIIGFLQRLYKPIYIWAMNTFATKEEVGLYPVDITTLSLESTFVAGAVIGINGVLYRATQATDNLPCTLVTENGVFVVNTVKGKTAFVVSDATPNTDWEIFTDAAIEYWVTIMNQRVSALENIPTTVTYNGVTYTTAQLLEAMAQLMAKTVVVHE